MNNLKIHCIIHIIIQTERVEKLENGKEESKTINNMLNSGAGKIHFNEDDSIEVNNLITLTDADVTPDLLEQLEAKALQEQEVMERENAPATINNLPPIAEEKNPAEQEDINIPMGLPADQEGSVNITTEILEKTKPEELNPIEEAALNANYKKYVVYINPDNEKFIDDLSIKERKEFINEIIYNQKTITKEERLERKRQEKQAKLMVSIVTFLVAVPIICFLFNISMQATMQNYKQSRSNFEVLYKNSGKIKVNQ